ncbi:MAG: membrane associated rhomboid family serine protease [Planctomycetota bacterium]|jgi:membrane associated rhomboid family serine protease
MNQGGSQGYGSGGYEPGGNSGGFGQGGGLRMPSLTPVVKHLILTNVVIFFLTFFLSFDDGVRRFVLDGLGLAPGLWRDWMPLVPVWQLLTYGFLHSLNGLSHLLFNMLGLYFFGTMLEAQVGPRRFLVAYLMAVLVGGLLHLIVSLATGGSIPAVGASGGVLGVMVACAVLSPDTRVIVIMFPVKLKYLVGFLVAGDLFGILVGLRDGGGDGVAHWVHLGGAIFGFLTVKRRWIWSDPVAKLEEKNAELKVERERAAELQVDDLLVKIQKEGLGSLSKREKEFLKKASKRKP